MKTLTIRANEWFYRFAKERPAPESIIVILKMVGVAGWIVGYGYLILKIKERYSCQLK